MIQSGDKEKIRDYVKAILRFGLKVSLDRPQLPQCPLLLEKRGIFVTLKKKGKLRGCIGYTDPIYALKDGLKLAALKAALEDPRFPPVLAEELDDIDIEISILSLPLPLNNPDTIQIGVHGLIIEQGHNKGLLLPQVATEFGWDKETFLSQVAIKAGLGPLAWKSARLFSFKADIFS